MNVAETINKLENKLIKKNDLNIETNELLNELLETLKIIENCKDKETDGNANKFTNGFLVWIFLYINMATSLITADSCDLVNFN